MENECEPFAGVGRDDRLGQPGADVVLASRGVCAQDVEWDTSGHSCQPGAKVAYDGPSVGLAAATPPAPRRAVADRAEHPVGDCSQLRAVLFELLATHASSSRSFTSHPFVAIRHEDDEHDAVDVRSPAFPKE